MVSRAERKVKLDRMTEEVNPKAYPLAEQVFSSQLLLKEVTSIFVRL